MKTADLKAGDIVRCTDGTFDCIHAGAFYKVVADAHGLFVTCEEETGRHYLDGFSPHDAAGELVGFELERGGVNIVTTFPESTPHRAAETRRLRAPTPLRETTLRPTHGHAFAALAPDLRIDDVQRVVCQVLGLAPRHMTSHSRVRRWARPRQVAMVLARELTGASLGEIGHRFGGRHHTTVLHAERRIAELLLCDPCLRTQVNAIRFALGVSRADRIDLAVAVACIGVAFANLGDALWPHAR